MARQSTDLPYGDSFGPGQLETDDDEPPELVVLLELAKKHEGNSDTFDKAVEDRFFQDSNKPALRAANVRRGMQKNGYKLVDDNFYFNDIAEELYEARDEPDEMFGRFAKHILLNCEGLKLLQIVDDIKAQGLKPTVPDIQEEFRQQYDFHIDHSTSDISQMRAWLNKAGIIGTRRNYDIDWSKVDKLTGASSETLLKLSDLTNQQEAFLKALALIDPDKPIKNSVVREVAEHAYGVNINQKRIVDDVLEPLQSEGFINYNKTTEVSGKSHVVSFTDKFESEVLFPLLKDVGERSGIPRRVLRSSFSDLRKQMESDDTHVKGLALETLAVKLGRILGLEFAGWHVRGRHTGGSEVDVVMDSVGTSFERWQIQCKNIGKKLRTGHVKEEVGVSRLVQSNVVLMVAREGIADDAKRFANRVMHRDNLTILFVEVDKLGEFDHKPNELIQYLRDQVREIHRFKKLSERDMIESEEELDEDREQEALDAFADELEEYEEDDEPDSKLDDFS